MKPEMKFTIMEITAAWNEAIKPEYLYQDCEDLFRFIKQILVSEAQKRAKHKKIAPTKLKKKSRAINKV